MYSHIKLRTFDYSQVLSPPEILRWEEVAVDLWNAKIRPNFILLNIHHPLTSNHYALLRGKLEGNERAELNCLSGFIDDY
jgi:hypothetical protein